ncbi:MAG: GHKL domain-containing protein [Bacteroidetes bacterium]|nr:MAG: GHKL domain-containing protein [Bacteroidota bacterium]TAG90199.1 MAG: GHKL domain-containing protein [Bacteroidota bacterium]
MQNVLNGMWLFLHKIIFFYSYLFKKISFYFWINIFCFAIHINLFSQESEKNKVTSVQSYILKLAYEQKEDFLQSLSEDSLKVLLKQFDHPISKIDVQNALSLKMMSLKTDEAEKMLEIAYKNAIHYEYFFGQYWNTRLQSWLYQTKANYHKAKLLLLKSIEKAKKINYRHGEALGYRFLAELAEKQSYYKIALENYQKSIDIHEETNNIKGITTDYWRLSILYDKLENYEFSIEANEKSLEYAKKLNQIEWIMRNYNRIGLSYQKQGNYEKSLDYLNKSYQLYTTKKKNKNADADFTLTLHSLAKTYTSMSKGENDTINQKAIRFFDESIGLQQKLFQRLAPETCIEKGILYQKINQIQKALESFEQAEKYALLVKNHQKYITASLKIAEILLKQNNTDVALEKTRKIYQYAKEKEILPEQIASLKLLADIYAKKGNIQEAFNTQKEYQNKYDSLKTRENREKSYEIYQQKLWQEQRNEIIIKKEQYKLEQKSEIQNAKVVRNMFIICLVFAFLAILLIGLLYRKQKNINKELVKKTTQTERQKKELVKRSEVLEKAYKKLAQSNSYQQNLVKEINLQKDEINEINKNLENKILERTQTLSQSLSETARLNDELDAFLYHASHDLRRPITTLFGLHELARLTLGESSKSIEIFDMVRQTAFNMDKMLVKLIMIHEINHVKKEETKKEKIKFGEIIQNIQKVYNNQIDEKSMVWKIRIENNLNFFSYKNLIEFIIQNLIENAVIFSQGEKPFIRIKIKKKDNFLHLRIEDNGQGIDPEIQSRIFEIYFRGSEQSQGNGLGLYVVYRAVHNLKGYLEFSSEIARGTTFDIYLPL